IKDNYITIGNSKPSGNGYLTIYSIKKGGLNGYNGLTQNSFYNNYYLNSTVFLEVDSNGNPTTDNNGITVIGHELGLALAFSNESSLDPSLTIMNHVVTSSTPLELDKESSKIIYNPTYVAGENIDNIMRYNWGFSSQ
ncbi:MAG TPA: hypothetical protein VMC80_02980, partial [Patescibacteria group bacterium]|nr:hypothetical protein [Patescibacteria group bacterium]